MSVNSSQEYAPEKSFWLTDKFEVLKFFGFYRKIFRAENILDGIKPRI